MTERAWDISKKFGDLAPARKKALRTSAALALWAFFLWRAILAFGPSTDINNVAFNSDSAIPVLMSNDERPITVFNLYYYGSDRWGAWPFLLTQLARRATGYRWTDQSLFALETLWLFVGALVFAGLAGRDAGAAALAFLLALCLHTESRLQIFELSQLYAWQTGALLFGWYGLRRLFESYARTAGKRPALKRAAWLFLVFASSFLAVWSSQASALFLFCLLHLEALRARLKSREQERAGGAALKPYLLGFSAVAVAVLLEQLQKWNYHRHALKHYGQDFTTHFSLDTGHLAQNLAAQFAHLGKLAWWPLYLLPTLGLLALVGGFAYAYFTRRAGLLGKLRAALAEDALIVAAGAYAIAASNFSLAVLVDHVRLNFYDDRFLTLTNLFGPASGLLTLYLLVKFVAARSPRLSAYARPAFLLAGTILLALAFPAPSYSLQYDLNRETARELARKAPRGLLMGGYWETYVFAGLQPEDTMTAVPAEGYEVRMPWTKAEARRAGQIIFAHKRAQPWAAVTAAERLEQYGSSLRLVDPKWYENEWYVFALYRNETQ